MTDLSRRRLLGAAGAAGFLAATGGWPASRRRGAAATTAPAATAGVLPLPADSGIDHIVVVMMENRSFDHFLGWLPGANGAQDTTTPRYPDADGKRHPNHHLTDPRGCGQGDPDHSYAGGRFQLHAGAMDNFARGHNDTHAIGFYAEADRPFMSALARHFIRAMEDAPVLCLSTSRPELLESVDLRRVLLLVPRPHLAQPVLPPRRPDPGAGQPPLDGDAADHLGSSQRTGRPDRPLLLLRCPLPRPVGAEVPVDLGALPPVPRRRPHGHASQRGLRRSEFRRLRGRTG